MVRDRRTNRPGTARTVQANIANGIEIIASTEGVNGKKTSLEHWIVEREACTIRINLAPLGKLLIMCNHMCVLIFECLRLVCFIHANAI